MTSNNIEKFTDSINSIGFENISIQAGGKDLIKNGNISLLKGKRYGLCGRNGSGKTSLLKFIQSLINNSIYIDQYIDNQQWKDINIVDAILESNKERLEALKKYNDLHEIDNEEEFEDIINTLEGLDIDRDISVVKKILRGLGFQDNDLEKNYYNFSGGWKTRVNLARAIYMQPRVLFLDEPTNHLDMEAIIWLEDYLQDYKGILIFVSHNIGFLNKVSTDVLHIFQSNVKQYTGNFNKFKKQLSIILEKQINDWNKQEKEIKNLKNKGKIKEVENILKKSIIVRPEKPYKIKMLFESSSYAKSPYITLDEISFGYSDLLLKNINLTLDESTRMTIVGLNGCGKSTLLKLIMGELKPRTGIILRNNNVSISYFNQSSIEELPNDLTPLEYLKEKYSLDDQEIRRILGSISLESEYHKKKISILSGGQKMRIAFSQVILEKPNVILLDEPTNHLDIETTECLIESLNNYNGCVLIISHDINLIEETNCLVYHLHNTSLKLLNNGIDEYIDFYLNL